MLKKREDDSGQRPHKNLSLRLGDRGGEKRGEPCRKYVPGLARGDLKKSGKGVRRGAAKSSRLLPSRFRPKKDKNQKQCMAKAGKERDLPICIV